MTNALTTTVEIVPNYHNQEGPRFSESYLPVATPFNYLDNGFKFMVQPLSIDIGFIAEWAEVLDLNSNNMQTIASMKGDYTQKPVHQFVERNSGDYMFFRFRDIMGTPITDKTWGENDYLSTKLSKFFDLHAVWYEVGLQHTLEAKEGNIVIDVIISYEDIKTLMNKAYDKQRETEVKEKVKAVNREETLLTVDILNEKGTQLFKPNNKPVSSPCKKFDKGFKEMDYEARGSMMNNIGALTTATILSNELDMTLVSAHFGYYDESEHKFTSDDDGEHIFIRYIETKAKTKISNDIWNSKTIIERCVVPPIADYVVWYETAVIPPDAKLQVNVEGKLLPVYPSSDGVTFTTEPVFGHLVVDLLISKDK